MRSICAASGSSQQRRANLIRRVVSFVAVFGLVALVGLLVSPAWAAVPSLCLYDDFAGSQIDAAKWQNLEQVREIRGGRLVLALRGSRPPGALFNSLSFINPTAIQSFRADVRLNAATYPPGGVSNIYLQGSYYNDGTGGSGDQTGDVFVELAVRADSTGVLIRYQVLKCLNSACAWPTGATALVGPVTVKPAALGEVHTLGIAWNGSVFTFTVDSTNFIVDPKPAQPIVHAAPNVPFKQLRLRLGMTGAGGEGSVAGDFDKVYVNGALYDDFDGAPFSGPRLDPAKWQSLDFVHEVISGQLLSKIAYVGGAGTLVNRSRFVNQNAVRALRANVTVTEFDSASGRVSARPLIGAFYNDGTSTGGTDATGDISAHIRISSENGSPLTVQIYSSRCTDALCTNEALLHQEDLATVNKGETHTLVLAWDGSVFTYALDGTTKTFDPKPFASVAKPPTSHWKDLRVQMNASAPASSGYIAATFDNVYVNCDALTLPKLVLFLRETLPGDVVSAGVGLRGTGTGTINLTTVPPGSTVKKAYLYWSTLGSSGTFTTPKLNGVAVAGTLIGQSDDPWWGVAQAFTYRADVTSRVTGNGAYTVSNLPAGPLPPANLTVNDSEGASLVVLYSMPGAPSRTILINEGAVTLSGYRLQYYATTFIGFTATSPPTGAKLTFVAGDGQSFTPEYAGLDTTLLSTDAFSGSDGNYWDTRTYDITSAMASSAMTATAKLGTANDSLVWVASVLSVPVVLPTVTVTATSGIATEGGVKGVFTFSRTGETASSPTVCFTVSGTASPGSDYQALPGCVTIPAGKSSATLPVTPLADKLHEVNESVIVTLRAGTSYTVGYPNAARVVILNEDPFPKAR